MFGGRESDSFYIGQMFFSDRTPAFGVLVDDPVNVTLTTRGYLSDGCRAGSSVTINGELSDV